MQEHLPLQPVTILQTARPVGNPVEHEKVKVHFFADLFVA
jgi:hypothetical protein